MCNTRRSKSLTFKDWWAENQDSFLLKEAYVEYLFERKQEGRPGTPSSFYRWGRKYYFETK